MKGGLLGAATDKRHRLGREERRAVGGDALHAQRARARVRRVRPDHYERPIGQTGERRVGLEVRVRRQGEAIRAPHLVASRVDAVGVGIQIATRAHIGEGQHATAFAVVDQVPVDERGALRLAADHEAGGEDRGAACVELLDPHHVGTAGVIEPTKPRAAVAAGCDLGHSGVAGKDAQGRVRRGGRGPLSTGG